MKNKILIIITVVGFILILILLNTFLNSQNNYLEIGKEENTMEILNVTSKKKKKEVLNSEKTVK